MVAVDGAHGTDPVVDVLRVSLPVHGRDRPVVPIVIDLASTVCAGGVGDGHRADDIPDAHRWATVRHDGVVERAARSDPASDRARGMKPVISLTTRWSAGFCDVSTPGAHDDG